MVRRDVVIESIAGGGDGVARVDGVATFVPRTAPGDHITTEFSTRKGGRFAKGKLLSVDQPGPARIKPSCAHYTADRCGGCQLQHMSYEAQVAAKSTIVRDAITRIAKSPIDAVHVTASPKQWRYRTKLTLAFRRRGARWIAGLHRYDAPDEVFSLSDCPITETRVTETWRDIMSASQHLPDDDLVRGTVQMTDEGIAFSLQGLEALAWPSRDAFLAAVPQLSDVTAYASFRQVNAEVGVLLHTHVIDRVRSYHPAFIVDAYAGSGATAIPLAQQGIRVTAIESDPAATDIIAKALPSGSRAICAKVEQALSAFDGADVVLVNPPRTGLAPEVTASLAQSRARAIIYVSCDPATLARDLTRMPSFRIAAIRSIDMFPQTAHVETVCELVPHDANISASIS